MVDKTKEILDMFCIATGMVINSSKSLVISWGLLENEKHYLTQNFHFMTLTFEASLKYLGFHLKEKIYLKGDSKWLIANIEIKMNT